MRRRRLLTAFLALWCGAVAAQMQVEIFTDRAHPIHNLDAVPGAVLYRIDRLPRALEEASRKLPPDSSRAAALAARRLEAMDRQASWIRRRDWPWPAGSTAWIATPPWCSTAEP
jgi:hypothetical protein